MQTRWKWILVCCAVVLMGCTSNLDVWRSRILVEWTTASEIDTAGFNLYRSEQPDGPWTKLNQELIPASTDPVAGGKYRYEDTIVTPGKTYYYEIEDVEFKGATKRYGPITVTASSPLEMNVQIFLFIALAGIFIAGITFSVRQIRKHRRQN